MSFAEIISFTIFCIYFLLFIAGVELIVILIFPPTVEERIAQLVSNGFTISKKGYEIYNSCSYGAPIITKNESWAVWKFNCAKDAAKKFVELSK